MKRRGDDIIQPRTRMTWAQLLERIDALGERAKKFQAQRPERTTDEYDEYMDNISSSLSADDVSRLYKAKG
jgi:hypothetical protein